MINWKYFRLIIGTVFFLILPPSLVTEKIEKVQIYSKAVAEETKKYSDRLTQENLQTQAQELDKKAKQKLENGELKTALETLQQLLDIHTQQGVRDSGTEFYRLNISSTLYSMASIDRQLQQYQKALENYQQALEIRQQLGDTEQIAVILHNIGTVYSHLSQYPQALASFNKALKMRRQLRDTTAISSTLNKIGVIYDRQGKYPKAIEFYEEALEMAKKEKDNVNLTAILSNLGLVNSRLGRYKQAIDFYQKVLQNNPQNKAKVLTYIGAIYRHLEEFSKALKFYQQALEVYEENQDRLNIAITIDNIGVIYREQEKYSQALESHQQALVIWEELGDREGKSASVHNIGIVYRESGQYSESLEFLTHTLILDRQLENQNRERITLADIGKLLAKNDRPELAIIFYKQSINITEKIRKDLQVLPVEEQKDYLDGTVTDIYRDLADLLLEQKRAIESHQILDLLKVQEVFEYMGGIKADDKSNEVIMLKLENIFIEKYTNFLDNIGTTDEKNQNISLEKLVAIHDFIRSDEITEVSSEIKKQSKSQKLTPEMLVLLQSELKEHNKENAVVLYPLILEDRLELILVTANSPPVHHTVLVNQEEFERVLLTFKVGLIDRRKVNNIFDSRVAKAGLKLYNWLIKPIENDLKINRVKTIIYAPDGKLRYIPLAALYDGEKWLTERFKINHITAASIMDLTPRRNRNIRILAGALTEGNYNFAIGKRQFEFEGLPFAKVEVEKLASIFPQTKKLLGDDFTKQFMELRMGSHSLIHFATHSAFVNGSPEDSFILYGDGELASLREVEKWNLYGVELVVLSACETGKGKLLGDGSEILGFGYQMQVAGAAASLATLWQVDDRGTSEFMNDFYTALKSGKNQAGSIQKAQIAMIKSEFNHPYYWAPFILIGNGF
ncbi:MULTISPECIES: tetratricopeptide repeat protein [unclassified Okeania]|uniref:CHAT domain-containing protein n=1 Tax=unclassified Okeania TaxID=2634635 RepID=UPI0013B9B18B|nr:MULTISPECIES: tetratricopeptide repeat protein [unclassified Okeania]NES75082.1 tetratricopeptide repeat protein [Okeania sp. SIO1H4]NET15615.1 tetratricopeptide repeat protein [Okeania sp. SIO1H6]NET22888.1 tetratricopeptide repeat protein [Okeania sp. SIO1H5]NET92962.1 tetratricopeptide repeat protein [Okeania sp. SIO1H2]